MGMTKTRKIMKKWLSILAALAIAVSGLAAVPAMAADTGHVSAVYKVDGANVQNMHFKLYKVGTVDSGEFKLDAPYDGAKVSMDFSGDTASDDMMASSSTLYSYMQSQGLDSGYEQQANPGADGEMSFETEKRVLYLLATDDEVSSGSDTYSARPMFIWFIENDDNSVTIKPMKTTKPNVPIPEEYTVVKHWSGDSASSRPDSVEVEIYENGKLQETVTLSSDNDWTYSWTDDDGEGKWTCVEKNVPTGYTSSVTEAEDGAKIIVTNKRPPHEPTTPGNPNKPRTGDPTTLRWSLVAMGISGIVLILAAFRRRREEQ